MRTVHERLKIRRQKDQPVTPVTINLPSDIVEDLQEIATLLGFSRYEALLRAYIGDGMRKDLARLDEAPIQRLAESLRKQGLSEAAIANVLAEAKLNIA
jgi:hypothetical protein